MELGAAEKVVRLIDLLWSRKWRKEESREGRLSYSVSKLEAS